MLSRSSLTAKKKLEFIGDVDVKSGRPETLGHPSTLNTFGYHHHKEAEYYTISVE